MHTPHRTCNEEDIDHAAASQFVVIFVMASLHIAGQREKMHTSHRTCNEGEGIDHAAASQFVVIFVMASLHVAGRREDMHPSHGPCGEGEDRCVAATVSCRFCKKS